jgi:hypothetical protein
MRSKWPAILSVTILTACSSDSGEGGGGATNIDTGNNGADMGLDFGLFPDESIEDATGEDVSRETGEDAAGEDAGWSPTLGEGCLGEDDCGLGEICVGVDPETNQAGYCTVLDCVLSSECGFGGEDDLFCCSNFGQYRGCFREVGRESCGDNSGVQDDECSVGGQSDCDGTSHFCIDFYGEAYCSAFCNPFAAPGDRGSCSEGHWCFETGGGNGLCVKSGDTDVREPCVEDPSSCAEGMLCDGAWEDPPDPYSYCTSLCDRDRDCSDEEWCRIWPNTFSGTCLPLGDRGEGESCAEDRFACEEDLYCISEGRYAVCSTICRRESDCDDDFYCAFFSEELGVCTTVGDRETGDGCGDDPRACGEDVFCIAGWGPGYNEDAYCSANCTEDSRICEEPFSCEDIGEFGSYCLPDGDAEARDECDGPFDCEYGTFCAYREGDGPGICLPGCGREGDCLSDEWCAPTGRDGGVCIPFGDIDAGDSCEEDRTGCEVGSFCAGDGPICIRECTDDEESCPDGHYCTAPGANDRRYCTPFGETEDGQRCSEAYECEAGSYCAFREATGEGVCTHGCEGDDDCSGDFWCFRTGTFSACLPEGDAEPSGDCSDDRFDCGEDQICLFADTDQAYCGMDCTGFADRCGEGEVCRWVGFGVNLCMAAGEVEAGEDCTLDVGACDEASICVGAGTEAAFCAGICTFDSEVCGDDTACRFFPSGFALCLPPEFEGETPL